MRGLLGDVKRLVEGVMPWSQWALVSQLPQLVTNVELLVIYLGADKLDLHFNNCTRHDRLGDGARCRNREGLAPAIQLSARRA